MDKDLIKEQLFSIFQKHQYYNLHDLIKLTIGYLKEILKEICMSKSAGVHRETYELKLEYSQGVNLPTWCSSLLGKLLFCDFNFLNLLGFILLCLKCLKKF